MKTMKKYEWVFFDLDGTLADSLGSMYNVYMRFLKKYGNIGNIQEFEKLNGPTLLEIVSHLKIKYNISGNKFDLLKIYENEIELSYQNEVQPIPGRQDLLNFCKKRGIKIALVTSSTKRIASAFLVKNNWMCFFDFIIYGDLIKQSKPNPEIYNFCLSETKANKDTVLVFEDSQNGYISASRAGLDCIIITNKSQQEIFSLFI